MLKLELNIGNVKYLGCLKSIKKDVSEDQGEFLDGFPRLYGSAAV